MATDRGRAQRSTWSQQPELSIAPHLTPADPGEEAAALGTLALPGTAANQAAAAAHLAPPLDQLHGKPYINL